MEIAVFTAGFVVIHTAAYVIAGVVAQRFFTRDLYAGPGALFAGYLRDMSDSSERATVARRMLPTQLLRGLLMALVLWPLLGAIGDLSLVVRVLFLAGLMFVYADFASAIPFPNTIEGWVYLKRRLVTRPTFLRLQAEAIIYSVLLGVVAGWLLFL